MEDVLELYQRPVCPTEPVSCFDERPVQLLEWVRPASPACPGREACRDYAYFRCGTANLFCVVEPKAGWHFVKATPNRKSPAFAEALQDIAKQYRRRTPSTWFWTTSVPTAAMRWRCGTGYVQGVGSGVDSLHTTRPSTAVGSIRRRWRFPCSPVSVWEGGVSPRSTSFAAKRRHGRSGPTATSSGFAGDSLCRRPERNSITTTLTSPGHRISG